MREEELTGEEGGETVRGGEEEVAGEEEQEVAGVEEEEVTGEEEGSMVEERRGDGVDERRRWSGGEVEWRRRMKR